MEVLGRSKTVTWPWLWCIDCVTATPWHRKLLVFICILSLFSQEITCANVGTFRIWLIHIISKWCVLLFSFTVIITSTVFHSVFRVYTSFIRKLSHHQSTDTLFMCKMNWVKMNNLETCGEKRISNFPESLPGCYEENLTHCQNAVSVCAAVQFRPLIFYYNWCL